MKKQSLSLFFLYITLACASTPIYAGWISSIIPKLVLSAMILPKIGIGDKKITLNSNGDVGQYSSLQINSAGNPVISYYDATDKKLRLKICDIWDCSTSIDVEVVGANGNDIGQYSSLRLNSLDHPVVSYYDATNGDLILLVCGDTICEEMTNNIVAAIDDVGQYSSLQLNSLDYPVIIFYDATNADLKIVFCGDNVCTSETNTHKRLAFTSDVGEYNSLQLNSLGYPVMSYYDATNGDLILLACKDTKCDSPSTVNIVAAIDDVGQYSSLQLNSLDYPVITFYDATNGDLKIVFCGDTVCTSETNTHGRLAFTRNVGQYNSLQLNSLGYPVMSYYDATNGDLILLACKATKCNSSIPSTIKIVDSTNYVGLYSSLQLNEDNAVISYYDFSNKSLKLAFIDLVTDSPSSDPTSSPTKKPTLSPTTPTSNPTQFPSKTPTIAPTFPTTYPTQNPSGNPTQFPTFPTSAPSSKPSRNPTFYPTNYPTQSPSKNPTFFPTSSPTVSPTMNISPDLTGESIDQININVDGVLNIIGTKEKYFKDEDDGVNDLILNSTLEDGKPLPDWIEFQVNGNLFSYKGTPKSNDATIYTILLFATDPQQERAAMRFVIQVNKKEANTSNDAGLSAVDAAKIFGSIGGGLITLIGFIWGFRRKYKNDIKEKVEKDLKKGELREEVEKESKRRCCNWLIGLTDAEFNAIVEKVKDNEEKAVNMFLDHKKNYEIEEKTQIPTARIRRWEISYKSYEGVKDKPSSRDVLSFFKDIENSANNLQRDTEKQLNTSIEMEKVEEGADEKS